MTRPHPAAATPTRQLAVIRLCQTRLSLIAHADARNLAPISVEIEQAYLLLMMAAEHAEGHDREAHPGLLCPACEREDDEAYRRNSTLAGAA